MAWFVSSGHDVVPEIGEGLRSTLFRRMSSLIAVAISNAAMLVIVATRHPEMAVLFGVALGLGLEVARICLITGIGRAIRTCSLCRRRVLVDLYVTSSLLWGLEFGASCFLCMRSGDPVLTMFSIVFGVGVIGALSARNPGSPRLTGTMMISILLPLTVGILSSPDLAMRLLAVLPLPYLWGMWSINAQLHGDYVAMLTAQWENRRRSLHCGLTGLPNASYFYEALGAAIAHGSGHQVSVLALDLDGFKGVNDRFGHPAGDVLLKQVADHIRRVEGPAVMGARIGGDEFAMVLKGVADDAAERLMVGLIGAIGQTYELGGASVTIGVSIGIATSTGGATDPTALYAQADQALYRAKRDGRGIWRRYGDAPPAAEGHLEKAPRRPPGACAEGGDRAVAAA